MSSALHKIDRKKWVTFFTHLLVIVMLFILPDVLLGYSRPPWGHDKPVGAALYIKSALFVLVFYVNYYVLLKRSLLTSPKRVWAFVGWNLLLVLFVVVVLYLTQYINNMEVGEPLKEGARMGGHHHRPPEMPEPDFFDSRLKLLRSASFWIRDIGMVVMTIGLSVALKLGENWSDMEQRHQEMLATQKAEELNNLKSQLNPHFLFNTLNTIYALIAVSPEEAQQAVHQLSGLLRYVLYENPATVALSKEIEFARSYISLMEMRLPKGAVKAQFFEQAPTEAQVPPLLFIALIENAFKHGNTGNSNQPINITIASLPDGTVVCNTSNYFNRPQDADPPRAGGIGMANLRRRLQLIYGDRATLEVHVEGDQYIAMLTIKPSQKI